MDANIKVAGHFQDIRWNYIRRQRYCIINVRYVRKDLWKRLNWMNICCCIRKNRNFRVRNRIAIKGMLQLHQTLNSIQILNPIFFFRVFCTWSSFFKEGYLKFHRERYHHPTTKKKNYICEICGAESFKTFVQLKSHLSSVHKQGPQKPKQKYQCDICLKFYSSQGSLYTHKLTHSTEIHKCTLCDKISPTAAALVCHMNAVHVEKKLKCTLCDKTFKLAPALKVFVAFSLIRL